MFLVVDDDPAFLAEAQTCLTDAGFRVIPAGSGQHGLLAIRALHRNLVAALIDLDLPDESGFTLLEELRKHAPDAKVLVVSGVCQDVVLEVAKYFGAALVLRKPIDPSRLAEAAKTILSPTAA